MREDASETEKTGKSAPDTAKPKGARSAIVQCNQPRPKTLSGQFK